MKNLNLKLLYLPSDCHPILPNDRPSPYFPLMMFTTLQSKLRGNLMVESLCKSLFLEGLLLILKVKPHPHKSKFLTRVKVVLLIHLRSWKGRNVSNVMVVGIFKLIVSERSLPLWRKKTFKLLRRYIVKKKQKMMFPLWSP